MFSFLQAWTMFTVCWETAAHRGSVYCPILKDILQERLDTRRGLSNLKNIQGKHIYVFGPIIWPSR